MYTIKTNLTNGEHKVSALSFTITPEVKPEVILTLAADSGETVTLTASMLDSFNIHYILEIMNSLVDGLNETFPVETLKFLEGDLFPHLEFISFKEFSNSLKTVEYLLKEFGAVITINLTGKKFEPLQILAVEAA